MKRLSRRQERRVKQRRLRHQRDRHARKQSVTNRQQWATQSPYPTWIVVSVPGQEAVVESVRHAIQQVRFDDYPFTPREQHLLRMVKGGVMACPAATMEMPLVSRAAQPIVIKMLYSLGQRLYDLMPQPQFASQLLCNDIRVSVVGNHLAATCLSLAGHDDVRASVHYSQHRPTIKIRDEQKVVAFSCSAIRRLYDLCVPGWRTYIGHEDAFETIANCIYYEPTQLPDGRPAFSCFQECRHGFWGRGYLEVLEGRWQAMTLRPYALRLGYCPCTIDGEFAVASDFVGPGHVSTAEHALLLGSHMPARKKDALLATAKRMSMSYLLQTSDWSAARWFHQHGIPQVVPLDHPIFAP